MQKENEYLIVDKMENMLKLLSTPAQKDKELRDSLLYNLSVLKRIFETKNFIIKNTKNVQEPRKATNPLDADLQKNSVY